jgi:beta-aspartyl-dipeptidase (metallo-type)
MVTLIEGGEVYDPAPVGRQPVLLVGGRVARVGAVDAAALARAFPGGVRTIDARGCVVVPGLIDPHAHLIGAGGERGPATREPELRWDEVIRAGVTTVVGCLGTDAVTRHLSSLLVKCRELESHGLSAFMYTGSFQVPPPTLTGSVQRDLVLIDKVIGAAEIAIADVRSSQPSVAELARVVADAYVGGTLAGKAGVTHFHVGPTDRRLSVLHRLLDDHDVVPRCLYPTHVTRSRELVDDAVALARRGAYVDTDTVEPDTGRWLRHYLEAGGPPDRWTFSSDARTAEGEPAKLMRALVDCVRRHELPLDRALPHFTANTATALQLDRKGRLRAGCDADLLVLRAGSLELVHAIANGRHLLADGVPREDMA